MPTSGAALARQQMIERLKQSHTDAIQDKSKEIKQDENDDVPAKNSSEARAKMVARLRGEKYVSKMKSTYREDKLDRIINDVVARFEAKRNASGATA